VAHRYVPLRMTPAANMTNRIAAMQQGITGRAVTPAAKEVPVVSAPLVHKAEAPLYASKLVSQPEPAPVAQTVRYNDILSVKREVAKPGVVRTHLNVDTTRETGEPSAAAQKEIIDRSVRVITQRVYSELERRLRTERMRKGMI
jgi:hypothetical protein